jgi:serine/threonine-protein phosphatase PP1 catalytic subunit
MFLFLLMKALDCDCVSFVFIE